MYIPCIWVPSILCMYHSVIFHLKFACTAFMALLTMLVYRNQQFGAYTVQTGMYSLRMAVAGGQLSCSCCTWLNHVQQLTYAYVHVFEEMLLLGSTYLSEQCMHRMDLCLCTYMFRPCIYHVHTWHIQFHSAMNKKYKKKTPCKAPASNP